MKYSEGSVYEENALGAANPPGPKAQKFLFNEVFEEDTGYYREGFIRYSFRSDSRNSLEFDNPLIQDFVLPFIKEKGLAKKASELLSRGSNYSIQINVEKAIKLAKALQPTKEFPENPQTTLGIAEDIKIEVADILMEKIPGMKDENVKYYTAVGTPLDLIGIDAFMEIQFPDTEGKPSSPVRVYFDAKLGDKGAGNFGEQEIILIPELSSPKQDEKEYLHEIEDIAKKAVKQALILELRRSRGVDPNYPPQLR